MVPNAFIYHATKYVDQVLSQRKVGQMLKVGEPAPDFSVLTHEGKRVSLRDFLGKKIVLWFYPKADTPG